jgi:hypothetical protein
VASDKQPRLDDRDRAAQPRAGLFASGASHILLRPPARGFGTGIPKSTTQVVEISRI